MKRILFILLSMILVYGHGGNVIEALPPAAIPDGRVVFMESTLRLRATPSTTSAILDLLESGTHLRIIGRTPDHDWLEVQTPDYQVGWVATEYVAVFIDLDHVPDRVDPGTGINFAACIYGIGDNTRDIFQRGQAMGNQAEVFAKVGDSITVSNNVFYPLGAGQYDLADYTNLQAAIDHFAQTTVQDSNPFTHTSLAAEVGWSALAVLDPELADPQHCNPGESPLLCEYRRINPAFALIMFGTNDVGYVAPVDFESHMRRIISLSIERGVIPVISTIPDRIDHEAAVDVYNRIIRRLADEYSIPLWDYGHAMAAVGRIGLTFDGVHPSSPPHGYEDTANFHAENLYYGYVIRNLTALHVLDALRREVVLRAEYPEG